MDIKQLHKHFLDSGSISTDSRTIQPGQLFFALKGDNFDGHLYVNEVLAKGASFAVISDSTYRSEQTILVQNTLTALQDLAKYHREYLEIPVIGITGSNGKTTTKELLIQVLSLKYRVHATQGNLNNHIGVPLTILQATKDIELMVIEMGANHLGEIEFLCNITKPDFGLITNIGKAHIEGFGSYEGVVSAKTELYHHLKDNNKLVFYNKEDRVLYENLPNGMKTFPYIDVVEFDPKSYFVSLRPKGHSSDYSEMQLIGSYNQANVLAALTVGTYFNIGLEKMIEALCAYAPSNNRSQKVKKKHCELILDAYNANPSSMKASINSFALAELESNKVLILGDMKELGIESISLHAEVLDIIARYKWHKVILVGPDFKSADKSGLYLHYADIETLSKSLNEILTMIKDTVCLIKASRSIQLEKIEALID